MPFGPESSAFPPVSASYDVPWWWLLLDPDGRVVEPQGARQEFPTRGDAESWVGEVWPELVEGGVAAVTLLEGDREVYGPMSLSA